MHQDEERRNFFRIDDEIEADFIEIAAKDIHRFDELDDPLLRYVKLMGILRQIDAENNAVLLQIGQSSPMTVKYLKAINQKIESLAQTVFTEDHKPKRWVNIGGAGIAFRHPTAIAKGHYMRASMILMPYHQAIVTLGKVIACEFNPGEDRESPYRIGLEFIDLPDAAQQLIMQHIFHKQAHDIRKSKKKPTDEDPPNQIPGESSSTTDEP